MPDLTRDEIEGLAAGLSEAERAALTPFTIFSDRVGKRLLSLGLLRCDDGVWTHTKAGQQVRTLLQEQSNG